MPVTPHELQQFNSFALGKLHNGPAASISELATIWDAERAEFEAAVNDVRQGIADEAAGKGEPLAQVFAELRRELGRLS